MWPPRQASPRPRSQSSSAVGRAALSGWWPDGGPIPLPGPPGTCWPGHLCCPAVLPSGSRPRVHAMHSCPRGQPRLLGLQRRGGPPRGLASFKALPTCPTAYGLEWGQCCNSPSTGALSQMQGPPSAGGWVGRGPSRSPGEPLPAAAAQHAGVLCPVGRPGTTAGSAHRAERLEGQARNGAMLGWGPAWQAGHPASGPSLASLSAAVGQPSGVGSRLGSRCPGPLPLITCFGAGFVLSVLFPAWKPLRLLPPAPLTLPTCAFPGGEGKSLAGMWVVSAGTSVHPGTGHSLGGGRGPGVGLGGGLGCLGNVAPCPSMSVGEAWVLGLVCPCYHSSQPSW